MRVLYFYNLEDKSGNAYPMHHIDYFDALEVSFYTIAVLFDTAGELNGHNKYLPLHIFDKYIQIE